MKSARRPASPMNVWSGRVMFPPPESSDVTSDQLAASMQQVADLLRDPDVRRQVEQHAKADPEVAELLERIHAAAVRILQLVRFANADRAGRKYGLTADQFWGLIFDQDWSCVICQSEFKPEGPRMNVDHNHDTGEVRGVLCHNCNTALGLLKDSPDLLDAALTYLEERGHYGPSVEDAS